MKDYNYAYNALKKSANELKELHWKQSGYLESSTGNENTSAQLVQRVYERYINDWNDFINDVTQNANQNNWNLQKALANYPEPQLPQETIEVGASGEWQPLNLEN